MNIMDYETWLEPWELEGYLPAALGNYSPVFIRTWAEAKHNAGRGSVRSLISKKIGTIYRSYTRAVD